MSEERFVLIKRGLFWRPDGCGYTSDLLKAGVYDRATAEKHDAWALEFPSEPTTSKPLYAAVREYVGRGLTREVLEAVLALLGLSDPSEPKAKS